MFTTDGLTRSTAPVTAREEASRNEGSASAPDPRREDSLLPLSDPAAWLRKTASQRTELETASLSSRLMLDRCRLIAFGFRAARSISSLRKKNRDQAWSRY